jgi:hypothetical protein
MNGLFDLLAAERSNNIRLSPLAKIARAREYLDAAGLGNLRPDKAWRPRSWEDRLKAVPYPEERLVDEMAQAIYEAHVGPSSVTWRQASEERRDWVRAQARAAVVYLRTLERGCS